MSVRGFPGMRLSVCDIPTANFLCLSSFCAHKNLFYIDFMRRAWFLMAACFVVLCAWPLHEAVSETLTTDSLRDGRITSFFDDFETADTSSWDHTELWGTDSLVQVHYAPSISTYVLKASASEKSSRVGKAYLSKNLAFMTYGDTVRIGATVYLPRPAKGDGNVYLIDLECRNCGYEEKPGIRFMVDSDGYLHVNRSKLGLQDDFLPEVDLKLEYGRIHKLDIVMKLGDYYDGRTQVYLDGVILIDAVGVNLPLNMVVKPLGVSLDAEQFDYVQVGVTANSDYSNRTVYFDDVSVAITGR